MSGGGLKDSWPGLPDLIGTPDIHVEAKRVERVSVYQSIQQAEKSIEVRGADEAPVVITRRNRMATEDSLCVLRLKDFIELYNNYLRNN